MNGKTFNPIEPNGEHMTFRDKLSHSLSVAREDYKFTDRRGKAVLFGMVAMGAYEWGPGNETVAPIISGQALDLADGVGGIMLTTAISGGLVAGQQLFSGMLARKTVEQFPKLGETTFSYMNTDNDETLKYKPFSQLPKYKQWLYAFTLGTSFTVCREAFATGRTDDAELKKVSHQSAVISGGSIALAAAGVDLVNQRFENNDGVQLVIDYGIKNPLFWLGIMGITLALNHRTKLPK